VFVTIWGLTYTMQTTIFKKDYEQRKLCHNDKIATPTTPFTADDAIIGDLFHNEIILLSHQQPTH